MDLQSLLPSDYGELLVTSGRKTQVKIGIVVPTFGRPEYVERTLASLAASDLTDCAVCLVDETTADTSGPQVEGFTGFFNLDSPGFDIGSLDASFAEIAQAATADPRCLAFNSCGWLKHRLAFFVPRTPGLRLFTRDEYLAGRKRLRERLSARSFQNADPKTTELVKRFELPGIPLLKILKSRHGNMFDSYRSGWKLLMDGFDCDYLVTLDSDTLVKPDWVQRLLSVHREVRPLTEYLLVSGFHTRSHKTLRVETNFRVKKSVGGVSLMFDRKLWNEIVMPSLVGLQWDFRVCHEVERLGGMVVTTRPSVVEHIGRSGLWSSWLRFDRAADF